MIISKSRQRMGYLAAFVILFLIEAAIALWVHDRFIRPYIGDVLVVVLVYVFGFSFHPAPGIWYCMCSCLPSAWRCCSISAWWSY